VSDQCQICGPNKSEAPIVICAPCALAQAGVDRELSELRSLKAELVKFRDGRWVAPFEDESEYAKIIRRHIDDIIALAPSARPA